jgi:hypothetical protein
VVLGVLASAGFLTGCATPEGSSQVAGHFLVNTPTTPFYRYGPAQSFGPDYSLKRGQRVLVMKKESGFSRVMTEDGQSGYVATEDLVAAPPPPPPPREQRRVASSGSRRKSRSGSRGSGPSSANQQILQGAPLFEPGDLPPLPVADPLQPSANNEKPPAEKKPAEKSKSKPGFRVNVPESERKP